MNKDDVQPVAYVTGYNNGYPVVRPLDSAAVLPTGLALYNCPAVSDTQELVECLRLVMLEHRTFFVIPEKLYERINAAVTKWEGK
jgi:hypothetical protein